MDVNISQAQLARVLGVSRQRVNFLVKEGVILLDGQGLINPVEAALRIEENLDLEEGDSLFYARQKIVLYYLVK